MNLIRKNLFIIASMLLLSCTTKKFVVPDHVVTTYKPATTLLAEQHMATINERDPVRRAIISKTIYTDDLDFEELGQQYDALHRQYPKSFFSIIEPVDARQSILRIKWKLGKPGMPAHSTGEDILFLKDEKIKSRYVFIDSHEGGRTYMPKRYPVAELN